MALEQFIKEWELGEELNYEELKADALADLGTVLLEEGHTWEAEECVTQAYDIFRKTRERGTPNNLDDLTWAMTGVTRGQHLWGRFSTLIRTQEKSKLDGVYEWKFSRRGFPLASMPTKWYKTDKRSAFDRHYAAVMPMPRSRVSSARISLRASSQIIIDRARRLFEFTPGEVKSRPTEWFQQKGFEDLFSFLNASNKPRYVPTVLMQDTRWMEESSSSDELFKRSREGIQEENREGLLIKPTYSGLTLPSRPMGGASLDEWKKEKRRHRHQERWKKLMDANLNVGERLMLLLDDVKNEMDDGEEGKEEGLVEKGKVSIERLYMDTDDDESEDSELKKVGKVESEVPPELFDFAKGQKVNFDNVVSFSE